MLEQYQLYLPPTWTTEKANTWYTCFFKNVAATGMWGMEAFDVATGAGITGSLNTYVWGQSGGLSPGGELLYLVEPILQDVRFDMTDKPAGALVVRGLVNGLWTDHRGPRRRRPPRRAARDRPVGRLRHRLGHVAREVTIARRRAHLERSGTGCQEPGGPGRQRDRASIRVVAVALELHTVVAHDDR